jgi:hypothetical protein
MHCHDSSNQLTDSCAEYGSKPRNNTNKHTLKDPQPN